MSISIREKNKHDALAIIRESCYSSEIQVNRMIPEFPQFKPLELSDKAEVESITSKYPPYSDFNFVSMWSWDVKGEMRISKLNGNLVVRFTDYINGQPFFSFLGDNKVNKTIEEIFEYCKKENMPQELRLVPEVSIKGFDEQRFKIIEDRDNFDYILDTVQAQELKGGSHRSKRRTLKDLVTKNNIEIKPISSFEEVSLFLGRCNESNSESLLSSENRAICRLFTIEEKSDIILLGMFHDGRLVGFVINELLPNAKYSIGHFMKVDPQFHNGVSLFLLKNISKVLHQKGFELINIEQDLGISGLRTWKQNHKPVSFLKKFIVSYK